MFMYGPPNIRNIKLTKGLWPKLYTHGVDGSCCNLHENSIIRPEIRN